MSAPFLRSIGDHIGTWREFRGVDRASGAVVLGTEANYQLNYPGQETVFACSRYTHRMGSEQVIADLARAIEAHDPRRAA